MNLRSNLILFVFILFSAPLWAQSINTGIKFYEEGNYESALRVFEQLDSPEAQLFSGKSQFGLNNFLKAKFYLQKVDSTAPEDIYSEARYTQALADFQLKNFSEALDALHELKKNSRTPSVSRMSFSLYREITQYLTMEQRLSAFRGTVYPEVRLDLVESVIGSVELGTAKALFNAYKNSMQHTDTAKIASIETLLSDSVAYWQRYNPNRYTKAPEGLAYNIGVALPAFDVETNEFEVSQHLYFGIQLAVENFNSDHSAQKAFITFRDTKADPSQASIIANDFKWNHSVDAIIGPLFSEVAREMADYAEMYQIPMLTPLANSDSLNLDLTYTFQLNPTFAIQGKTIANYAIQKLGFDTLAVIAERGSLGEPSAVAFLDEARKQGAEVVRYFVEDLESQGYDISEYVKYFDPEVDTVFNYNIDAVYAPFTGNISETLINSLLTYLEAMESEMTILGSEEWEGADLDTRNLPSTQIYYTKTFERDSANTALQDFESAFRLRFNMNPNRFAYIGYDAARVILTNLQKVQNPAYLKKGLKSFNRYRGLITDVSFRGTHINQEVKVKRIGPEFLPESESDSN